MIWCHFAKVLSLSKAGKVLKMEALASVEKLCDIFLLRVSGGHGAFLGGEWVFFLFVRLRLPLDSFQRLELKRNFFCPGI